MTHHRTRAALLCAAVAVLVPACGGSGAPSPNPGNPSGPSGPGTNEPPGAIGATITISASGVSPKSVTIQRGQRVAFVNDDSLERVMSSDPHPIHTDCPALTVGGVPPGQTRESSNLSAARTCSYHDHNDPLNNGLLGSVVVQ